MAPVRDWLSTLWPASYMGVPFFFERDTSKGGRALAVHEFFDTDDPYVEDTGRKPRYYSGTAYVASDVADTQAVQLEEIFESEGPGTLVVPIAGPVQVHCEEFERVAEKDKLGFISFTVRFVRVGAPAAQSSIALLGQQIFDAADAVASALAGRFPAALTLSNPADYVMAAAINEVLTVAAGVEATRTVNPVDPETSAAVAATDAAIVAATPALIAFGNPANAAGIAALLAESPAIDPALTDPTAVLVAVMTATIRLLGDGMKDNADAGAGALLSLAQSFPTPIAATAPPGAVSASANATAIAAAGRVAALTAWCEALERQVYASRPDGVAARAAVAERIEIELANWTGAAGFPVYVALRNLQGAVVQYLTRLIADLAPVVTVTAPQSRPALWWAWRLYGDPARAVDLTLRNAVVHPSFMPTDFQALAPGFAAPSSLPTAWPAP